MKPAPFDYVAPTTVAQVVDTLADESRDAKVIAGGQSLLPMLNLRLAHPELLIDVRRVRGLGRLGVDDTGSLVVGAGITQAATMADPAVQRGWPLLAAGISHIGHPQIRNRGTVCGSIAHHDSSAELPTLALALDATFRVASSTGTREVAAQDMFVATFMTALEAGDLLTEVVLPAQPAGTGWSFRECARRRGDFATVGVAVLLRRDGHRIHEARVVFCGAGSTPVRSRRAEEALVGAPPEAKVLDAARQELARDLDPPEDVHATAEFRQEMAGELFAAAVGQAWERSS